MAQPPVRDPFRHTFVVSAEIVAVLLNLLVLLGGGGLALLFELFIANSFGGISGTITLIAFCFFAIGLINFRCIVHVYGFNVFEGTRVYKVANVVNGFLIFIATIMAVNHAPLLIVLPVLGTAIATLIAIHYGRSKPIPAGHCQTCGYDLAGLDGGVCPECGNE